MKIYEIRLMSNEELLTKLADNRQEYMNIRFQVTTGQQTDTSRLSAMRKTIAQFETIVRERQLNLNQGLEDKAKAMKSRAASKAARAEKKTEKETVKTENEVSDPVAVAEKEPKPTKAPKKTTPKSAKAESKVKETKSKKTKEGDK